jgi:hypothetical protein
MIPPTRERPSTLHGVMVFKESFRVVRVKYTIQVITGEITYEGLPTLYSKVHMRRLLMEHYKAIKRIIRVDITLPHLHYNYTGDEDV